MYLSSTLSTPQLEAMLAERERSLRIAKRLHRATSCLTHEVKAVREALRHARVRDENVRASERQAEHCRVLDASARAAREFEASVERRLAWLRSPAADTHLETLERERLNALGPTRRRLQGARDSLRHEIRQARQTCGV